MIKNKIYVVNSKFSDVMHLHDMSLTNINMYTYTYEYLLEYKNSIVQIYVLQQMINSNHIFILFIKTGSVISSCSRISSIYLYKFTVIFFRKSICETHFKLTVDELSAHMHLPSKKWKKKKYGTHYELGTQIWIKKW